ncbi:(+)-cis,trans-nepetalactol synthase NEPS2-like [Rhodamnia argentea]|uniref:(+)-cis,trans-nepetalactol synthase NEPS2-like n=1 Tax=Rhodamnia argentea TaxID=178133 RepID=A0ABM3HLA0_9MYRT|nr:(+)-cis,trans-nepetalactol synthase NEPS2-like [Rhodamnia argentea]
MSKHAVLGLARSASKQLGAYGIRVNCVSPGAIATPLLRGALGVSKEEGERMFESRSCLKGVLKAKHVADAVVFLASEEAEFINGHNLAVDGGCNDGLSQGI